MNFCSTSPVLCLFLSLSLVLSALAAATGQKEHPEHGARSPSERFEDEHYKGGHHEEDLDHQAVLGSKKDAEEFDTLSPEESKNRLRVLATTMDADKDGFVSKQELTDWIAKSMKTLDEEETGDRFSEIDDNKDGHISWEEYKQDAFGEDNEGEPDAEEKKLMEEDQRYFAAADSDHDGRLTSTEFMAFQNPEHHKHMHDTLVELTLKDKDADKDGQLNFKEFIGDAGGDEGQWFEVEKNRFENDYDKNHDGVLDKDEMKAWLVPDIATTAKEEADHLYSEADKNKDSKLSIDEIVDEHQLFVGSEATNYGEHLEKIEL